MIETWAHRVCLAAVALLVLVVLDAPLRTFRQRWQSVRWAERMVLLSIELNFVLVWAMFVLVMRHDVRLAPASWSAACAVTGAAVAIGGSALAMAARLALGQWFSGTFGVKPGHELITSGPYAVVRHPMYTGLLAMVAGCALAWQSAFTLALAAALVVPFWFHTAIEEPMFVEHFGDAYRQYQKRVPRLVPGWRGRAGGARPGSAPAGEAGK